MKQLRNQTGLPSDVTKPLGEPSSSYGFVRQNLVGRAASRSSPLNNGDQTQSRMNTFTFISDSEPRTFLSENPNRNYLLVQNNGTTTLFVSFGSTPTVGGNNAIQLPSGTGITFEAGICPNNDVSIVSVGTNLVSIVEGTRIA